MLTSRLTTAIVGALTLGAVHAATPAAAAPVVAGQAQAAQSADSGLVQQVWHRGYAHGRQYGPPRHYGYGHRGYQSRCFYRNQRVWNGYRWVHRSVRVCR